jgi:hypothetical protein
MSSPPTPTEPGRPISPRLRRGDVIVRRPHPGYAKAGLLPPGGVKTKGGIAPTQVGAGGSDLPGKRTSQLPSTPLDALIRRITNKPRSHHASPLSTDRSRPVRAGSSGSPRRITLRTSWTAVGPSVDLGPHAARTQQYPCQSKLIHETQALAATLASPLSALLRKADMPD